jgi:radical SAM protein with 4Fe4S-binding SPASM domain
MARVEANIADIPALQDKEQTVTAPETKPRCHIPWQEMNIDADGNVTPCCNWLSHNNTGNPYCGNVKSQTLAEIWNGPVYRNLRKHMATGDLEKSGCAKCMLIVRGDESPLRYDNEVEVEIAEKPQEALSDYAANIKQLKHEIATAAEVMQAKPTIISATPSYACNIRCVHCYQEPSRTKDLNQPSLFDQLSELAPTLSHIQCGGGEPFLLPIWHNFLDSVNLEKNPYLTFAACTNATILSDKMASKIERFKRVQIGVSMDAGTKDVYERVRIRSKFENVDKNVEQLVAIARSKPGSYISMSMSVMRDNIEDIANFFIYATAKGASAALSPVMAMPADQAITCFSDPTSELPRWKEALDAAVRIVDTLDLSHISDLPDVVREGYRGQIRFVRDQILWNLEKTSHFLLTGEIPPIRMDPGSAEDHHPGDSIIIFSPVDGDNSTNAPRYFSKIVDGCFSVVMSPGIYGVGVIKRFDWPRYHPNWKCIVSDGGLASFQQSLAGAESPGVVTWGEPISSGDADCYNKINAFQENTNTWVSSQAGGDVARVANLGLDLGPGELPTITEVRVQWAFDYSTPTLVALQFSVDGQLWGTDSEHGVNLADGSPSFWWQGLPVSKPRMCRFWRVLALSGGRGGGSIAIGQMRFIQAGFGTQETVRDHQTRLGGPRR